MNETITLISDPERIIATLFHSFIVYCLIINTTYVLLLMRQLLGSPCDLLNEAVNTSCTEMCMKDTQTALGYGDGQQSLSAVLSI